MEGGGGLQTFGNKCKLEKLKVILESQSRPGSDACVVSLLMETSGLHRPSLPPGEEFHRIITINNEESISGYVIP